MRLFGVDYMDDCDVETYLAVGDSTEEVEKRETEKLQNQCACFMGCWVFEVNEIDGHKIIVE